MTGLTRAGWLMSAAAAGALLGSILHTHYAGPVPFAILLGVAVLSFVRADWALPAVAALIPIAWYSATQAWNPQIVWAEAVACAAIVGLGLDACRTRTAVPRALAVPAAVFGAIVLASLAAGLSVLQLREGPAFWDRIGTTIGRSYFVDRSLTAVHAGLLLLEGTLLFAHAARLGTQPGILRRVAAGTALGSAAAAICTLDRLTEAAARRPPFLPSLVDLSGQLRWNVHYTDYNAAGSFYALAVLVAAALAVSAAGARRALWTALWAAAAVLGGAALWLTSSRIALIAVPAAAAGAWILPHAIRGRRQAAIAGIATIGVCAALVLLAVVLPQRGSQKSSLLAADIRVGLIETAAQMIRSHPAYGIGLGEFQRRSGEFSSPELIAKFPAAVNENAHNNLLQITAETGLMGGLAFAWTIAAALLGAGWRATMARDRFLLLVFAGLVAFALTALAGHPLLVPEASFAFWIVAGAAGGAAFGDRPAAARTWRPVSALAALLAIVVLTAPLRVRAAGRDANLEHVGFGVSAWHYSPDGIRYREATGHATLFVPAGPYKFSISLHTGATTALEVTIDGRVADVHTLVPGRWNDIVIAGGAASGDGRFRRMDLRTVSDDRAVFWITKNEPVLPR